MMGHKFAVKYIIVIASRQILVSCYRDRPDRSVDEMKTYCWSPSIANQTIEALQILLADWSWCFWHDWIEQKYGGWLEM